MGVRLIKSCRDSESHALCSGSSLTMPFSYGQIGSELIKWHFQNMLDWGYSSPLQHDNPSCSPLAPREFIARVLVPEAAVLLIMDDQGWTPSPSSDVSWNEAYARAAVVRTESVEYGKVKFRGLGGEADKIFKEWSRSVDERRGWIEKSRRQTKAGYAKGGKEKVNVVVLDDEDQDSVVSSHNRDTEDDDKATSAVEDQPYESPTRGRLHIRWGGSGGKDGSAMSSRHLLEQPSGSDKVSRSPKGIEGYELFPDQHPHGTPTPALSAGSKPRSKWKPKNIAPPPPSQSSQPKASQQSQGSFDDCDLHWNEKGFAELDVIAANYQPSTGTMTRIV